MANVIQVVGEVANGKLVPITAELLGAARRLVGESSGAVGCALMGSGVERLAQEAIAFGAEEALVVDEPALAEYNSDAYIQAMARLAEHAAPSIILFGQTNLGRDLAPRLAFRLNTGVVMDCVELAWRATGWWRPGPATAATLAPLTSCGRTRRSRPCAPSPRTRWNTTAAARAR